MGDDRPGRVLSSLTGALAASVYSGLTVFLSVAGAGAGPTECWAGIRLDGGRRRMPVDPGPSTSRSRSASKSIKEQTGQLPQLKHRAPGHDGKFLRRAAQQDADQDPEPRIQTGACRLSRRPLTGSPARHWHGANLKGPIRGPRWAPRDSEEGMYWEQRAPWTTGNLKRNSGSNLQTGSEQL